jgi:hypothetical protein
LLNLLLVAAAGVIIRSKIIFPLGFIHQKNFLHGHSHFAFSGWVSAAIMAAMIAIVYPSGPGKRMAQLFRLQMIASYGMLITFPMMGYKLPSIFFATATIVISFIFCFFIWKPLSLLPREVSVWFKTALLCNLLSSLGTFVLAYLMVMGSHSQELTIGSLYFFLHFQYNGWFFFGCAGLFFYMLYDADASWSRKTIMTIWRLLAISVIPSYFLSALWMKLPGWMNGFAIFAAITQLPAIFVFVKELYKGKILPGLKPMARYCLLLSLIAVSIKFIFQALSCIPALSIYAFGYRSLVIAFLHLVLLGFVSLFMLGYFVQSELLPGSRGMKKGVIVFTTGIMLNEAVLMIQGLSAIGYIAIPHTNEILWGIALIMFSGILILMRKSA